jgi:hypothetical protein
MCLIGLLGVIVNYSLVMNGFFSFMDTINLSCFAFFRIQILFYFYHQTLSTLHDIIFLGKASYTSYVSM